MRCPNELNLSNALVVNPQEWPGTQYILAKGRYVFTVLHDSTNTIQPGTIGVAAFQREWAGLSASGDYMTAEVYDPMAVSSGIYLGGIDLEVSFLRSAITANEQFDVEEMARNFLRAFEGHIFSVGQLLVFEFHGHNLRLVVRGVNVVEAGQIDAKGGASGPPTGMDKVRDSA